MALHPDPGAGPWSADYANTTNRTRRVRVVMVVVMSVRPISARAIAGDGAGAGSVACEGWKCMAEEKHATPGGCQALRRNKANDFRWMQLKPMICATACAS